MTDGPTEDRSGAAPLGASEAPDAVAAVDPAESDDAIEALAEADAASGLPEGAEAALPHRTAGRARLVSAVMLGVASGSILVPLNSTMLAVALPGVMDEFGLGASTVASLVSLYLGSVAIALPVAGTLGDRFGARRVFLLGVLGFGVGSLLATVAGSFAVLEASRIVQAASGALVSTSSAALIRETAPADRRGEAFGLFDLLTSTSAAVGPFVGGLIVGWFGWRAMFFVAIPIAAASAIVVFVLLHPARHAARGGPGPAPGGAAHPRPLDVPGLVLLALGIVAFLVGIGAFGATDSTVQLIAAVAVIPLLAAFVIVELREPHPAVDPRLLTRRAFSAALIGVFGATVVLHGSFILVPLLVERLLGQTATISGIVLLGIAGVGALVAPFGGRISDRRGRRLVVVAGSFVSAAGLAVLALPASIASAAVVALLLGVVGFGNGLTSPRQAAALESVEPQRVGMAAGTYYTGRYLGGVVGASLAGALLGASVTAGGVSQGFAILAATMVVVGIASLWLPGRRRMGEAAPA
ncbi:MAG TPA: MFS transporter [Candidatus Limnocylindrales bacterium]